MAVRITDGGLNWTASIDDAPLNNSIKSLREKLREYRKAANESFDTKVIADYNRKIQETQGEIRKLNSLGRSPSAGGLTETINSAKTALIGFFAVSKGTELISQIIAVRGEFQQLETGFRVMLGSKEKADNLMQTLVQFAAKTPFTLTEVATGAKQMLAYGFAAKDVEKQLNVLGNVASGVGSNLGDIVYLYGTLKASGRVTQMDMNQFAGRGIPIYKALAETMGIATTQVKEYVQAGRVGFADIEKAFQSMAGEGGIFFNLMQENSKSVTGQISNLSDSFATMLNEIGKSNEGFIYSGISGLKYLTDNYKTVLHILEALVVTYGVYKTAVIVTSALETAKVTSTINKGYKVITVTRSMTAAELLANTQRKLAVFWQNALNKATLSNPYVIAGAALVAFIGYLVMFADEADAAVEAQKKVNAIMEEAHASTIEETTKIRDNTKVLKDNTASITDKHTAVTNLRGVMKAHLQGYTDEEILAGKATLAIYAYVKSLEDAAVQKGLFDEKVRLLIQKSKTKTGDDLSYPKQAMVWLLSLRDKQAGKMLEGNFVGTANKENKEDSDIALKVNELALNKIKQDGSTDYLQKQADKLTKDLALAKSNKVKYNAILAEIKGINTQIAFNNAVKSETDKKVFNKKYYEDIVADFTSKLEALDKKTKDFKKLSATYKNEISKAQKELLSFEMDKKGGAGGTGISKIQALVKDVADAEIKANQAGMTKQLSQIDKIKQEYQKLKDRAKDLKAPKAIVERIDRAEGKELAAQKQKDDYEEYKTHLDSKKNIYSDYENAKQAIGEKSAKAFFALAKDAQGNDIADFTTYLNLKLEKTLENSQERKLVEKEIFENDKKIAADKIALLSRALGNAETQSDALLAIDKDYYAQVAALGADATAEQKANLARQRDNLKESLNSSQFDIKSDWQKLFNYYDVMSKEVVLKQIQTRRDLLIANQNDPEKKLSPEEFTARNNDLTNLEYKVNDPMGNKPAKALERYNELLKTNAKDSTTAKEAWNEYINSVVSKAQLGIDALKGLQEITNLIGGGLSDQTNKDIDNALGIVEGNMTMAKGILTDDPAAIIQGGIKLVTSAIKLFDRQDINLEKKIAGYRNILKSLEKSYRSLQNQVENSVGNSYYEDSEKLIQNLEKQKAAIAEMRKAEEDKKKTDQSKIDDYDRQLEDAALKQQELAKAVSQNLLQTEYKALSNTLADALTSAFMAGEDGVKSLNNAFEDFIGKSIKNSLRLALLEPIVKQVTDDLVKYGKDNGNSIAGFDFKPAIGKLQDAGKQFTEALGTMPEYFKTDKSKAQGGGMAGAIKRDLTEETGTLIAGQFNGMRLAQIEANTLLSNIGMMGAKQLEVATANLETAIKIEQNTKRTADTADTYLPYLKNMSDSIGGNLNIALRSQGK